MRVGDIVVNPWVNKFFYGVLNSNYATIYLGHRKVLDYNGDIKEFGFDTKINKHDPNETEREWKVIGHVDIKSIIFDVLAESEEV